MPEENKDEVSETTSTETDSASGEAGRSEEKETAAPSKIPENLKGLSAEQLIKMQGELERKLGEQSATVAEAKKLKENQRILAEAIYSDPKLAKDVETALQKKMGISTETQEEDKESDGEASDVRKTLENRAISEFSEKFGINKLKKEDREKVLKEVGGELADIIDPTGKKSMSQVLKSVSLDKLPKLLEKAYYLSNMDKIMSGEQDTTAFASIGRVSSSSSSSDDSDDKLTSDEEKVAEKLGISKEKYLKRKKEIKK